MNIVAFHRGTLERFALRALFFGLWEIAMTDENKEDFELEWIFAEYGAGRAVSEIAKELDKSEGYV